MNFLPIFPSLETLSEPLISRENFWFIIDQTPLTFQCIKQDFWDWGHEIALNWSRYFLAVKTIFFFFFFLLFFSLSNKFTFLEKHSGVLSLILRSSNIDALGWRPTEAATQTIWRDSSISYLSSGSYILLLFSQNCCDCVCVSVCVCLNKLPDGLDGMGTQGYFPP